VNPADLRVLRDGDLESREAGLNDLMSRARDGDTTAAAVLRAMITDYPDYHRTLYSRALNYAEVFGDATLEAPLLASLADTRYNCQAWAAMGCTALGFTSAVPLLLTMLDHPQWIAREQAVIGLGELAEESEVPALVPLLGANEEWMRQRTAEALAKIGGDVAFDALWEELEYRRFNRIGYIASSLAEFVPEVIPKLIGATVDGDADQRYWAAIALGSTGDETAVPALEQLLDDDGETVFDGWVKVAAKKGLRTLRRIQAAKAARAKE
jgi:HEAT repeat protein